MFSECPQAQIRELSASSFPKRKSSASIAAPANRGGEGLKRQSTRNFLKRFQEAKKQVFMEIPHLVANNFKHLRVRRLRMKTHTEFFKRNCYGGAGEDLSDGLDGWVQTSVLPRQYDTGV